MAGAPGNDGPDGLTAPAVILVGRVPGLRFEAATRCPRITWIGLSPVCVVGFARAVSSNRIGHAAWSLGCVSRLPVVAIPRASVAWGLNERVSAPGLMAILPLSRTLTPCPYR